MADAVFEGKEGRWITTKTGKHIFIPNDKSVKEVLADVFEDFDWENDPDDDWSRAGEMKKYYNFFVPEITDPKEKAHKDKLMKSFKGILDSQYAYIRDGFKNALMKHKVYDMPMENCIADMMMTKDQVRYMYLQDIWTRKEDTYYSRGRRRIQVKYDGDSYTTLSNYYHEAGHALDAEPGMSYDYSSYVRRDNQYGMSISELLLEEITEDKLPIITKAIQDMKSHLNEVAKQFTAGEISRDEYRSWTRPKWNVPSSLGDVVHAALGFDKAMEATGEFGHGRGYYSNAFTKEGDIRRGTEFFAEMVDSLVTDKNKQFANIMEQIAPKSCEVFYKIMKEKWGYERK